MFSSVLSALSGMLAFSKGLDVISNNVANMNTPGFKASEIEFRDMFYRFGMGQGDGTPQDQIGEGVNAGFTRINNQQGQFQQTGNALDVAIDGNGFFVLEKDGKAFYTRSGQFEFNTDGFLVEHASQARVQGFDGGQAHDISIAGLRINPPHATTEIKFSNNLSSGTDTTTTPFTINNVNVIDGAGKTHTFTLKFTKNAGTTSTDSTGSVSWTVSVSDETGQIATGEIRYQGDGTPVSGFNKVTFNYSPAGAPQTSITLNFGDPGSTSGSTGFSAGTQSTLQVSTQDGFAAGSIVNFSFDDQGALTIKYSNGQTKVADKLALATFENVQSLTRSGDGLLQAPDGERRTIAAAGEQGMGKIAPKQIELSNVQLTEEFTDIVVIQRGFQASSQIISVTNDMMQQLLDLRTQR